jgi:hypothetical protein
LAIQGVAHSSPSGQVTTSLAPQGGGMTVVVLRVVLAGAFIGLFGKVVIASSLDIPVWLVMACGVGGGVSGWLLVGAISVEGSPASE